MWQQFQDGYLAVRALNGWMWRGASVVHVTEDDDFQKDGGTERLEINLRHILKVESIGPGGCG